ncbi:MAG: hypothetical protein ACRD13_00160 [Terriglobales bacterium]
MALESGPWLDENVSCIRATVERATASDFFQERKRRNVAGPPPVFSREFFWYVLTGCLLTTQQKSTPGQPVDRFMHKEPFPLALPLMQPGNVATLVLSEIRQFGGIRFGPTIANRAEANFQVLSCGGWLAAETNFQILLEQRKRTPAAPDRAAERAAARWAVETLEGLGPKQSRNLWQWLGLTRYEIPLDSRVAAWANKNLDSRMKIDPKELGVPARYESVLDRVQALCGAAGVLPCLLDAAAFVEGGSG